MPYNACSCGLATTRNSVQDERVLSWQEALQRLSPISVENRCCPSRKLLSNTTHRRDGYGVKPAIPRFLNPSNFHRRSRDGMKKKWMRIFDA